MAAQRVTEWLETPKIEYHERQLENVYRSTVHFFDWLDSIHYIQDGMVIMDIACGPAANLAYMGKRYPKCMFVGVDLNPDFVKWGNDILKERNVENACVELGDWYNLKKKYKDMFDGVVSFQTLGWLPDFREPISAICNLRPKWQAHTSLFYDGLVSATTETQTYDEKGREKRKLFYNVYSIPVVARHLAGNGYVNFQATPFEIDIDLPKTGEFRSYTEKTEDGRRLQISGPVFMPWYFIAAKRGND